MIKSTLILMAIFMLLSVGYSGALQGTWIITNISGLIVIPSQVRLTVEDAIFRNSSIQQKFMFSGCKQFMYLGNTLDNNLFIDYNTLYQLPIVGSNNVTVTCSSRQNNFNALIQNVIQRTFYFQIFANFLTFIGPDQKNLITFSRDLSASPNKVNLRGKWVITRINYAPTSQSLFVSDNQMNLCQGALDVSITYDGKDRIKLQIIRNDNCTQPQLINAIKNSVFYRFKDNLTILYDANISSTLIISYLQNITNQQYQADKKAAMAALAPAPNITTTRNQTSSAANAFKLSNNQSDLIGQWSPVSVFGIPLSNSPISIIFTFSSITYQGGCNTYAFAYTVEESTKKITLGQNKSSQNNCAVNDDGLYITGISSISTYNMRINSALNSIVMNLLSTDGSVVIQLTRPVPVSPSTERSNINTNTNTNTNTNRNTNSQSSQLTRNTQPARLSLVPNTYVFLILARRDVPRTFCNITSSTITYTGCNKISHVFQAKPDGTIIITGGVVGNSTTCKNNNDALMYNTFNSAKYFTSGAIGSFILQDENKVDIINLSLF